MKGLLKTVTGALLAAGLATGAMAQEVTLRFQHFISPRGAVPMNFMVPWIEKVEDESGGRIKIDLYPAMQLGGPPTALYDQIRDNVIDGGWAIPGYTPGRFPAAEVFELPFIGSTSAEKTSKALWEFYEKYLTGTFKDIKVLAVHVHGPGVIHTKGATVNGLADMKGLKLRTPTRIAAEVLAAAGSTPIGMPVPSLPEALSKGVVDGGVIPWEIVLPLKINELADAHTMMGGNRSLYNTVFIWGMNRDAYDRLPDDLKAVIDNNSGLMASQWAGRAMDEGDGVGLAKTTDGDNSIVTLSDEETAKFKALAQPVIEAWIQTMSDKGLPAAQMVEDARALVAKHD